MAGIVGTIYGKRKGLSRTFSLNASELAPHCTQSRSPRSLSPWPGSLCANGHVCQVNSLCRTAVTPSPSPRSLSHFSVYLLSRGGRATARTRPPSHSLPPSLPRSLRVIGDGVRHCGVCVGVGGGLRPVSVRPSVLRADGGRAGARTSHMPVCHPQAHPRLSQARSYSKSGALQRWIPGYRRCTDRPTVQPN